MFFELYRTSFLAGETSITWGGETITRVWDDGTMFLYCGVILIVMIISSYAEKKRITLSYKYQQCQIPSQNRTYTSVLKCLKFIFILLLLIMGFRHTEVGIDTIVYKGGIEQDLTLQQRFLDSSTEPLYKVFQHLLHLIFNNGTIGVFIYSYLTLYFLYGGIKRYVGEVNVYIALLAYVCIFFFPSLNLLRISLAASFIFYNFHYLIEGKYKKFAFLILLSSLLHYSCIVMFLPFLSYLLYRKNKFIAAILFAVLTIIIVASSSILTDYISLINRYTGYIENNESSGSIGIMLFFDYFPCLLVCYYILKNKVKGDWADLIVCFTASAFLIRMMSYYIQIAGRLSYHFPILLMLLLPYWVSYFKNNKSSFYKPMLFCCIAWALLRLHFYFKGYLSMDGIMPYMFIWQ